jgi:hypothetical protein
MKSNREMFYPGMMNPMMPGAGMGMPSTGTGMPATPMTGAPNMGMPNNQWIQGYNTATAGDLERRVDMLERQVKRLDTRIARLETPYTGGQYPAGQPYSTSVPSQDYMSTGYPSSMHMM